MDINKDYLEGQKHWQEFPLVTYEHGTADDGQLLLHCFLDGNRGNILPSSCDDQLCKEREDALTLELLMVYNKNNASSVHTRCGSMVT